MYSLLLENGINTDADWVRVIAWVVAFVACGALGFSLVTFVAQRALQGVPMAADYFAHRSAAVTISIASVLFGACSYGMTLWTIYPIGLALMFRYEWHRTSPHLKAFIEAYEPLTARTASESSE